MTFRDKDFEVDREINKKIYAGLTSDVAGQKQDEIIRFYLSNRDKFFSNELIDFLNSTGIDVTKENEILYYTIDDNQMIIEGWYDVVGKVLNNERVVSFFWGDELYTINIYFGDDLRQGIYPDFGGYETFRFDFSILVQKDKI